MLATVPRKLGRHELEMLGFLAAHVRPRRYNPEISQEIRFVLVTRSYRSAIGASRKVKRMVVEEQVGMSYVRSCRLIEMMERMREVEVECNHYTRYLTSCN